MTASRDRALAALYGLAIGDALGMPTQLMNRAAITERYGRLTGFEPAAADHPLAAGLSAGSITDDTEQALLLAGMLVEGRGRIDPREFAAALVAWEQGMRERGSLDLLGPSTSRAVRAVHAGEAVELAGRFGTTNGAAMRVTPVGIAVGSRDLPLLVDRVVEASVVSHNTGVAIAGASAVAAAVSAGVDGATVHEAFEAAIAAAAIARTRGNWVAAADVSRRIRWAIDLADPADPDRSLTDIYELVGTSLATQESVPAAFGVLATLPDDPWQACLAAASLGGDSDTVAAMVGAVAGATHGTAGFPAEARETVDRVNGLRLAQVVDALLELR
ncbi:ADP-ribosylglycohydrolase family protein [Lacisediminihabitans profunda]|uniref:ADP-ribosylglycohydrolase family protein n=1 Tax=Lacisediminihabitans profunda TaxID=2594790 RepID=A0A5C8UVE2_9MICO|nr:ADP-ribosylglycohydrolase family protein [Lacisediminihabitans profunda]TXN32631.1 ADP-ribosylglycohydrolase family protein [Lacisediminihabitans profunda]